MRLAAADHGAPSSLMGQLRWWWWLVGLPVPMKDDVPLSWGGRLGEDHVSAFVPLQMMAVTAAAVDLSRGIVALLPHTTRLDPAISVSLGEPLICDRTMEAPWCRFPSCALHLGSSTSASGTGAWQRLWGPGF